MQADKSLQIVSFIKVVMMILVVLYHSAIMYMMPSWSPEPPIYTSEYIKYFAQWLNTMHIYTFTAMSGYIFYYLVYEQNRYTGFRKLMKKKYTRLLKPYIITSILWVIPFYLYFFDGTLMAIFRKYVLGIAPSQLWFLLMLFWVFMIFMFLNQKIDLRGGQYL